MNYKSHGIVIRRDNFGEADRRVTLYTDRFGKISILAKGSRRPTAKLASAVNLLNEISFVAAQGRSLDILIEAQIIKSHDKISDNLKKTKAAYWTCELIDKIIHSDEPHPALYELLCRTLDQFEKQYSDLTLSYFIYQCLNELGYRPELEKCVSCDKELDPKKKIVFSPMAGGTVSFCCTGPGGQPINTDTIKAMRFLDKPFKVVQKLNIPSATQKELHDHLKNFAEFIVQKKIKSEEL